MAPKRLKEDPPPAAASSGEEEEDSENDAASDEEEHEVSNAVQEKEKSDDEEEDEDDDDEESPAGKLTVIPSSNKGSDNESGSGSDSESESDSFNDKSSPPSPSLSAYTIKPIASKPMEPKKSTAAKPINSKKRKVVASSSAITNGDDEDSKKHTGGVSRLWSDENELAVLKAMIEYKSKKGLDPISDMGDFHEFIKKNVSVEVSKNQVVDKIRRMKKKYQVNVERAGDNGENPVFSKPHEQRCFELSKKIWGIEAGSTRKAKPPTRGIANNNINSNNNSIAIALPARKKEKEKEKDKEKEKEACLDNGEVKDEKEEEFVASYPCLNSVLESGEEGFSRLGKRFKMELVTGIGSAKATELETKWKKVREAELEVYLKRVELVHEQAKLMLEAFKNRA